MEYNSNSIEVLEGLEAVRVRPGMYIGSVNSKGLHHLVWEILDNSIDEHLSKFCDEIYLTLNSDGSVTVEDNGRGIPVDLHKKGVSSARLVFTVLHAGGKFGSGTYKISGGLHGVGASVVNALSSFLEVEIYKDGKVHKDQYKDGGKPVTILKDGLLPVVGKTQKSGTKITFKPDDSIFETVEFKPDIIKRRLKELSYLNKDLKLWFIHGDEKILYYNQDGIKGFLTELTKDKPTVFDDSIYIEEKRDGIEVELAFQYLKEYSENIVSFCNNINTVEGGTHVTGFKASLTKVVNQYAKSLNVLKKGELNFEGRDVRSGLVAIISLRYTSPQYEGQTKTKLSNTEVKGLVEEMLNSELIKTFEKDDSLVKLILNNCLNSRKLRNAEESLKTKITNSSSLSLMSNGKLASCKKRDPKKTELFLVEGDSAGGSAKQARNRDYQAILPLKGKIINVEKKGINKVLANEEISTLISVLGCGFGEGLGNDFDITKLKYDKIIVLTDADIDGSHIKTLLLTFFFRHMPELIHEGKVFIGMPPLYKIKQNKNILYLYNDDELKALQNNKISSLSESQISIAKKIKLNKPYEMQRYKGLGEMNPEQLWDTTMNPLTRQLKSVSVDSSLTADEITDVLMGDKVPPRREFIQQKALFANIDV